MRAFVQPPTSPAADVRFTYNGPSVGSAPLGSGQLRRQFGLKLRAQDSCNLIYVMWRIAPRAQLVVSIKRNPGKHTHAQCGTKGYRNLKPDRIDRDPRAAARRLASAARGATGSGLERSGRRRRSMGRQSWRSKSVIRRPVGLRSDNVNVSFEMDATENGGARKSHPVLPARPVDED